MLSGHHYFGSLTFVGTGCRQLILGEELRGTNLVEQGFTFKLERQCCLEHPEELQKLLGEFPAFWTYLV